MMIMMYDDVDGCECLSMMMMMLNDDGDVDDNH